MELHQLEAFSAVISAGSITGAGRLLGRSQPGVTRAIQDLELELGYALFDRKGPRVTPTQRAFLLYAEVERSLVGLEAIRASARAIGLDEARPLRVAATPALAAALVPRALARSGAPADTHLRSAAAEQVVDALLSRAVDIGIATLPLAHGDIDLHYVIEAPCVAVLHHADTLTQAASLSLSQLAPRGLATVANRYRLRRGIDRAFEAAGLRAHVVLESNASLNAMMAAQAGLAVAIVDPATAFGTPVAGVVTRALDVDIPFFYGVFSAAGRPPRDDVKAFVEAVETISLELLPGAKRHGAERHDALVARREASGSLHASEGAIA
ncbi:LysR family transcriptional regulator [Paraburkholderia lycopersici]|uniref:DNA-binding transcriptional regulator, LysR family n=1 Tax=Paraburkholderia lycopersici TaxID=416944 RepID=A0A1G6MSQ5_9BURK|nr:LysR family transcriptional regulator [Paraburkholderia lycopersici]SDC58593.1 DNA-binding transcriptional regulator, LysR family [Paraburkholderia lycopersici]